MWWYQYYFIWNKQENLITVSDILSIIKENVILQNSEV